MWEENRMAIRRSMDGTLAAFLVASCTGLAACMFSLQAQAAKTDFNEVWPVKWCDKTDPNADCGRFDVDLIQLGNKISGESYGARA